jgi:DNA adenine methylase
MDGSTRYYRHEMSNDDHAELLDQLLALRGMVVLNGYPSALYDDALKGWQKFSKLSRASAARGTAVRTEVIWINPACSDALAKQPNQQGRLCA